MKFGFGRTVCDCSDSSGTSRAGSRVFPLLSKRPTCPQPAQALAAEETGLLSRRAPKVCLGIRLGPSIDWAAEIGRWSPSF